MEVKINSTGEWLWAEYENMTVESENNNYTLHVTGYHGNAGDAFNDDHKVNWQSNDMPFSTLDVDNDQKTGENGNCAINRGGWWFRRCSSSYLNSVSFYSIWYSTPRPNRVMIRVKASRMMLQCGMG